VEVIADPAGAATAGARLAFYTSMNSAWDIPKMHGNGRVLIIDVDALAVKCCDRSVARTHNPAEPWRCAPPQRLAGKSKRKGDTFMKEVVLKKPAPTSFHDALAARRLYSCVGPIDEPV